MSVRMLQRKVPVHRRTPDHANPLYGYDYRPDWPSILSVAHDEADGGRLLVITDRPCVLVSAALPLAVAGLSILGADTILPVKFRLQMNGAVPAHSPWQWTLDSTSLYDPMTGHGLNRSAGTCADFPGPFTPPIVASVIGEGAGGSTCTLQFDHPIVLNGAPMDGAITFDDQAPLSVGLIAPDTLEFVPASPVTSSSLWAINRQPGWMTTYLLVPENGNFE